MGALSILRQFWDRIAEKQLDAAVALLDPKGQFWSRPIGYVPMPAFIYIMRAVQTGAPMRFAICSEMEQGERAIIEFEGFGTFQSGELYNNSYVFVADVRGGLIVDLREYSDSAYANEVFGRNLPADVLTEFGAMVAAARSGA